ncbi:hypothetical protein DJ568_04070 [Mucilaginibacter hurinus]|uniref:Uncharacterized protein n=1 Tax=Mucilaginibacter hurinus TaxID=2201324 RepID=A0A367GR46_9SPHI|nr:hypothetical protein [Mucilaginibacter hurinus]RCH55937.1 hypothetical protein DJ568_04070 [Mucilaginibacter hurinus]
MKNPFLTLAVATALIGAVATGCSSTEKAGGSDTTATDSAGMMTDTASMTTPATTDTAGTMSDTAKTDSVR